MKITLATFLSVTFFVPIFACADFVSCRLFKDSHVTPMATFQAPVDTAGDYAKIDIWNTDQSKSRYKVFYNFPLPSVKFPGSINISIEDSLTGSKAYAQSEIGETKFLSVSIGRYGNDAEPQITASCRAYTN